MSHEEKIKLIDDLIQENPDANIRDYLETLKEVEFVERSVLVKEYAIKD